jgi:hypothetical protein
MAAAVAANPVAVRRAEELVEREMGGRDASHDAAHALRVRDLALSLAAEQGLSSPDRILIVITTYLLFLLPQLVFRCAKFHGGLVAAGGIGRSPT